METSRLSLAQQIAQLNEADPVDFGPEDADAGVDADDAAEVDSSAARAHYLDVGPSEIRRLHHSIADPKYDGIGTTRKELGLMNDSDETGSEMNEDEAGESNSNDEGESGEEEEDDDEDGDEEEDEDVTPPNANEDMEEQSRAEHGEINSSKRSIVDPEDLTATLRKTRDDDRKKGKAVTRQITLWDTLLDARIRMQKSVTAANRLPIPSSMQQLISLPEHQEHLIKMLEEAALLSEELFELQEYLLVSNESVSPPPRKRRKIQTNNTLEDYSLYVQDATEAVSTVEQALHPYVLQTLSKWSSKIQAVAPSVLLPSNRNAFSTKGPQHVKSAVQLIEESLADHGKLLARTQTRRSKVAQTDEGNKQGEEGNPEVFDDTDFYQQLLRDVIDARGNGGRGAEDWMVIQKQKKASKKVDTKASKGRKLRYEVHEKLQNFMVPVPVAGAWHDEQIDELFASLLGKGYEGAFGANEDVDEDMGDTEKRLEDQLGEALKGGFRVFG